MITGNLISYSDIDTLGGNSGSGILRASDGRLVGIHTNGGCTCDQPGRRRQQFRPTDRRGDRYIADPSGDAAEESAGAGPRGDTAVSRSRDKLDIFVTDRAASSSPLRGSLDSRLVARLVAAERRPAAAGRPRPRGVAKP